MKLKSASLITALCLVIGAAVFFVNESGAQGKTYKIGNKGPAGGWIFYDKGSYSDGWRYLEAAPVDQSDKVKWGYWGCSGKSIPGAQGEAIGTGKSNTQAIIESCGEANLAAKLCTEYRGGGKSDWFLPSKDELYLIYANLRKNAIGGFAVNPYWSSSENNADYAWHQVFHDGRQGFHFKFDGGKVRAVRAF